MLRTDIKIAWRNLGKYKFFSTINVVGLALSMSAALLIITVIRNQFGYDTFHPSPERTFRVITEAIRKDGGAEKYASTPFPAGVALRDDYAVAEQVTHLCFGPSGDATAGSNTLPLNGYYADPAFFKVFGFDLKAGNEADALSAPFSMILTEEAALKFFGGSEQAMDKTLDVRNFGQFKITGVLKKTEQKTHLRFEALASVSTMISLEKELTAQEAENAVSTNWRNYYQTYTFALLRPGKTEADLATVLNEISSSRYKGLVLESRDAGYRFHPQQLSEITPASEMLSQTMESAMPMFIVWGLMGVVFLLMLFPCLNYANLTIARSLVRAKEVGVRKVMGAKRHELVRQFLTEAVLTAGLATVVAWFLRFPLVGLMEGVAPNTDSELYSPFSEDWTTYLLFGAFSLIVGLASGWLPATYLARFRPDAALRDLSGIRLFSRVNLRKALIVMQFALSLVFLIVVAAMWQQLNFATQANYGFDKENILNIQLREVDHRALAEEIARDSRVVRVSASSHTIGTWEDFSVDIRKTRDAEPIPVRCFYVDQNYIPNHGLTLVRGENFPADANPEREQYVILNEKGLEFFQLGAPSEALGKTLWLNDSTEVTVKGVVKDYHFRPFTYAIGPLLLLYSPANFYQLDVRLTPGDPSGAIASMEGIWKKFDQLHPMDYDFVDQKLSDCYAEMRKSTGLLLFFATIAISVACLGLLGIVTFSVETRSKEISIRKVIGASATEVALLLSRNFFILLGVAIFIALPVAYLAANALLQSFAYRIEIGAGLMLGCAGALVVLGLLTVGLQTLRAAAANPAKNLRSE
ncbi:MAG: ABC transporter permease [Saprospiraceae bacterium]|nr:ABC transporter permease [Saprospiraceae bacterium]